MSATVADRPEARASAAPPQTVVGHVVATPVSWGAIMAGAVVAIVAGTMLNVLGAAVGAANVDAVQRDTPQLQTFTVAGGIWAAVASALGLLLGGMVAARLASTWNRKDAALHGLAVWGVAFLLAIALVGSAVSGGTVAAIRGVTGATTMVAGTAVAGGAAAASQIEPRAVAEQLQRRLVAPTDPAAAPREQVSAEMADIALRRIRDGSWRAEDRQRMEQLLAASAGVSAEEARTRIDQAERELTARAAEAAEAARRAADAAAAAAALVAFWAFAAMLLGLGAAIGGAWLATRDEPLAARVRTV